MGQPLAALASPEAQRQKGNPVLFEARFSVFEADELSSCQNAEMAAMIFDNSC